MNKITIEITDNGALVAESVRKLVEVGVNGINPDNMPRAVVRLVSTVTSAWEDELRLSTDTTGNDSRPEVWCTALQDDRYEIGREAHAALDDDEIMVVTGAELRTIIMCAMAVLR
jgi:hypothetical protein